MNLPELTGSPKQIEWATRIRSERLRIWQESSPERFGEIEKSLVKISDSGWWISYRDKDIVTVFNHFREGVDLRKIQSDEWAKRQKKQEQKDRADVRAYLKKEMVKEADGQRNEGKKVATTPVSGAAGDGMLRFVGQAIDTRSGKVDRDPDLPF